MALLPRLLTFISLLSLFNAATGQNFPVCSRSDADATTLERCVDTVVFAIRAVLNASDDFDEACLDLDLGEAASEELDVAFLRILVCGKFNNQGRFYGDTDNVITELALARVALEVASDESNDPALRYICHGLDLNLYQKFQLPASTIYQLACGDLFIPDPPSSISSVSASSTLSLSINSSIPTGTGLSDYYTGIRPTGYPTIFTKPPPFLPTGYTSTPCTGSSASSTPVAVYKRQSSDFDDPNFWIKVLNSAIFALDLIETNIDDERCDAGDFWIDFWNAMGFFGDYVNALICASTANNTVFPPKTIVQARASLVISLDGIILTMKDPKNLARQIACDNLSYAVLSQAKLDAASIINFICYSGGSNSTTGPTTSSNSSTTTTSSSSTTSSFSSSTTTTTSSSTTTTSLTSSTSSTTSSSISLSTTSPSSSTTTTSDSSTTSTTSSSTTLTTSSSSISTTSSSSSSTTSSSSSSTTSSSSDSSTSPTSSSSTTVSLSSSTSTTPSSSTTSTSGSSSTTSSSSSTSTTSSDSTTSPSSTSSSSSSSCSYIYGYGGYRYTCPTTTLDTSVSTTTTLSAR